MKRRERFSRELDGVMNDTWGRSDARGYIIKDISMDCYDRGYRDSKKDNNGKVLKLGILGAAIIYLANKFSKKNRQEEVSNEETNEEEIESE